MLITDPPVEITDSLWMLGTNEYPLFLFRGQHEAAIFEGGIGAMGPLLREQMQRLGIPTGPVKQAVVTHAHPDHVMAVPMFRELFPGLTVAASPAAAKTLAVEKAISFFVKVDQTLTGSMLKAGSIAEEHRPEPLAEMQIPVDRLIEEGDTIAVDGISFNVLETPGHSDCSLSFHQPDSGILFISDATGYYIPQYDDWWVNYFVGFSTYLDSIRRLAQLDAEILCLGHLGVFKGAEEIKTYFDRAIRATQQCHDRIVEETNAGRSGREIAEQLGSEVHKKTQLMPLDFVQKNCGLLVKQSLKHEGISPEKSG